MDTIEDIPPSAEWYHLRNLVYDKAFAEAEALLTANPRLKTERNLTGETVLHFLAVENDIAGVKWLFRHGFNIHSETYFGESILDEVASLGYTELIDWLKKQGAKTGTGKLSETVTLSNGKTLAKADFDKNVEKLLKENNLL